MQKKNYENTVLGILLDTKGTKNKCFLIKILCAIAAKLNSILKTKVLHYNHNENTIRISPHRKTVHFYTLFPRFFFTYAPPKEFMIPGTSGQHSSLATI